MIYLFKTDNLAAPAISLIPVRTKKVKTGGSACKFLLNQKKPKIYSWLILPSVFSGDIILKKKEDF